MACMNMVPNATKEWNELPHIIFTSGDECNPKLTDHSLTDTEDWYNSIKDVHDGLPQT